MSSHAHHWIPMCGDEYCPTCEERCRICYGTRKGRDREWPTPSDQDFVARWGFYPADEDRPTCERGTDGCCVDHTRSPKWEGCESW